MVQLAALLRQPTTSARRRSSRQAGQALVEMAFVLTLLCGLFVAAFDYGRVVNVYLVTVHAAREAGRVAAVAGTPQSAIASAAASAVSDSIAASDLTVTCRSAIFAPSSGSFTPSGPCASSQVADTAFIVTVGTTVAPIIPMTGLFFESGVIGSIHVSYTVSGVVLAGT
jgi:Flp pilus assembly protein TadG